MTVMHKHHIVPRYRCEELGIDPDFEENIVEVTREQHALIHWGYRCGDLEPLLEVCDPSPEILEMISFGDGRDTGAAVILAQNEIDDIKMPTGKDHPAYKHGKSYNPEHLSEYYKEWCSKNKGRISEYRKEYRSKNKENLSEYKKEYYQKNKEKTLEYQRQYYGKNKAEILDKNKKWSDKNKDTIRKHQQKYRSKPENRERKKLYDKQYYAKKKAEKLAQQTGATLPL